MTSPRQRPPWLRRSARWAGFAVIGGAVLGMLRMSWLAWPDVLVDFGRELYVVVALLDWIPGAIEKAGGSRRVLVSLTLVVLVAGVALHVETATPAPTKRSPSSRRAP